MHRPPHPRMARLTYVLTLAVTLGSLGPPAAAHLLRHGDPNDTSSHLDIQVSRIRDHRYLPAIVRFYDRFHMQWDGSVLIFLDTFGGLRWDYEVVCSWTRDRGDYCDVVARRGHRFYEYDIAAVTSASR
jgi:hypothetical protein